MKQKAAWSRHCFLGTFLLPRPRSPIKQGKLRVLFPFFQFAKWNSLEETSSPLEARKLLGFDEEDLHNWPYKPGGASPTWVGIARM